MPSQSNRGRDVRLLKSQRREERNNQMKKQERTKMVSWMILSSAIALPCLGDVALDPGSGLFRPGSGSVPTYTNANPSWASNIVLAMLNAPMVGAFSGSVTTKVIALNGVDASGGLGFTYQFNL